MSTTRHGCRWRAGAWCTAVVALVLVAGLAQARPRLGTHPSGDCRLAGCNYYTQRGQCVLSSDGADGLALVLDRVPVRLKYRERRPVFRTVPDRAMAPGNRFVSIYESVESAAGGVEVRILDVVVRPKGACEPGSTGCPTTHYRSRIRITSPRGTLEFQGRGRCDAGG